MIYVAQPGDRALADATHRERVARLRNDVEIMLADLDLCWYDPIKPFGLPMRDVEAVYRVNEFALRESKGVLAVLPFDVPTIGAPMEILTAVTQRKPVAVVGGNDSLQLGGLKRKYARLETFPEDAGGVREAIRWLMSRPASLRDIGRRVERVFARGGIVQGATVQAIGEDLRHVEAVPEPEPERVFGAPVLKWQGPKRCEPKRVHESDCGYDLFVEAGCTIPAGGFSDVSMGIRVELPEGVWGMVTGRSSTVRKKQLLVTQGIIDNGYRGDIFAGVQNLNRHEYRVEPGERIAQMLLFPMTVPPTEQVDFLTDSDRGEKAFGSSGD